MLRDMTMSPTPVARFGWVHERRVFVYAAVLAADAAQVGGQGFGAADVRFFFLLFTNWVEHDVLHPEHDLELTQVRRVLERLVGDGWAARTRRGARGKRFLLRGAGVVGLAAVLGDTLDAGRPFEEALFVVGFASSYGTAIRARIRALGEGRRGPKEVSRLLDPHALVARARRRTRAVLADLDERITSGKELAAEAARATDEGDALRRLGARGSYQLERVRPLADLFRALPADVRRFELEAGIALRVRLLFEPLAARARTELAQLEAVDAALREAR